MQGDRVMLRPMETADTDDVLRMRNNPDVLAQLFSDKFLTREEHLQWLDQILAQGTRQEFMIVELASGLSAGTIGLDHIDFKHRRAEFGILIGDTEARGKGLASEASRLLLDYAFGKLGLHRIYLYSFSDNKPALCLYRKLGFVMEGLLQGHVVKNGERRDVIVMAMIHAGYIRKQ